MSVKVLLLRNGTRSDMFLIVKNLGSGSGLTPTFDSNKI